MYAQTLSRLVWALPLLLMFQIEATAAPACKGANKNDPGCPDAVEPPPEPVSAVSAAIVDSVSVDWINQQLIVRGTGLAAVTAFSIGSSVPLATANVTDTLLDIPFNTAFASAVTLKGNYVLKADGADVISIYFKSEVVDPAATGCPCSTEWATSLGGLWGSQETQCLEIEGPGVNDAADISGTILTDPNDPSVYPQYPIGAAFLPSDPVGSTCRLVQVDGDATVSDLVQVRINEGQQAACAATLKTNICASSTPAP